MADRSSVRPALYRARRTRHPFFREFEQRSCSARSHNELASRSGLENAGELGVDVVDEVLTTDAQPGVARREEVLLEDVRVRSDLGQAVMRPADRVIVRQRR